MPFAMDAFHLARAQFAFTVAFHIIFPAFSIGLAVSVGGGSGVRAGRVKTRSAAAAFSSRRVSDRSRKAAAPCFAACAPAFAP